MTVQWSGKLRSPDKKKKKQKQKHGEESGPGKTQIIVTQFKQKMLRDLTDDLFMNLKHAHTNTHTQTEQSVTE